MLREPAEYPNSFGPLGPGDERIESYRFTLCLGGGRRWNTVQRQRFQADEVDEVLDEVRSLLRARGRDRTQWEIGSAAEPPDLARRWSALAGVARTGHSSVLAGTKLPLAARRRS